MIGFWYNKALFAKAGIARRPRPGRLPRGREQAQGERRCALAIAGKDMWPSMHLWTYLLVRIGGADALKQMIQSKNWNTPAARRPATRCSS